MDVTDHTLARKPYSLNYAPVARPGFLAVIGGGRLIVLKASLCHAMIH